MTATTNATVSWTRVLTATNVALPLSNWVSLVTNQFGAGRQFVFTNGIAPGERERYSKSAPRERAVKGLGMKRSQVIA
jgi:hypothetical protein